MKMQKAALFIVVKYVFREDRGVHSAVCTAASSQARRKRNEKNGRTTANIPARMSGNGYDLSKKRNIVENKAKWECIVFLIGDPDSPDAVKRDPGSLKFPV